MTLHPLTFYALLSLAFTLGGLLFAMLAAGKRADSEFIDYEKDSEA